MADEMREEHRRRLLANGIYRGNNDFACA